MFASNREEFLVICRPCLVNFNTISVRLIHGRLQLTMKEIHIHVIEYITNSYGNQDMHIIFAMTLKYQTFTLYTLFSAAKTSTNRQHRLSPYTLK